jgi:hypothetical protein
MRTVCVAGVPLSKSVPGNHCAKFSIPHIGRCFSAPFKRIGAHIKSDRSNTWPSTLTRGGKPQFIFQLLSWFELTRAVSYASIPRRSGTVPSSPLLGLAKRMVPLCSTSRPLFQESVYTVWPLMKNRERPWRPPTQEARSISEDVAQKIAINIRAHFGIQRMGQAG